MHSDACKHHDCQRPLKLRIVATGEILELFHWSVGQGGAGFVATFTNGAQQSDAVVRETMIVEACECGESTPAERWPSPASMFGRIEAGAHHPEQAQDEVFLSNYMPDDIAGCGWSTKRLGLNAYDIEGARIRGMQPMFIKASEALGAGFKIEDGRLVIKRSTAAA